MKLPLGQTFETWEEDFHPQKTYHVAQNAPNASDTNNGSETAPFKTISKAASVLKAGEAVEVHKGVYREWVKPENGGISPDKMIWYYAAKGEDVVIKGSDEWSPQWVKSRYIGKDKNFITYEATLKGSQFEGANPFCLLNGRIDGSWGYNKEFEFCRGMIFLKGEKLRQVSNYDNLENLNPQDAGLFWVEENGMTIHIRLQKEMGPNGLTFEITTREQVFAPVTRYLNYIKMSGFKMFHAANPVPIPWPQRGLVSTFGGHHWIIEDCEIGYANTIGIDMGGGWWYYGKGEAQGYNIIRRNYIHHFGVCGIAGWHNMSNEHVLVEDNLLRECCTMPFPGHCENAAIKIHRTFNSLIRRNVIVKTYYGSSIWLDGEIYNTRITQNVCLQNYDCTWGQIFLEVNQGPNMVDNNIMYETHRFNYGPGIDNAHGFHIHDAEKATILQNLIFNGEDHAIDIANGSPERPGTGPTGWDRYFRVYGNIIGAYRVAIHFPNETSKSDKNFFGFYKSDLAYGFVGNGKDNINFDDWKKLGNDTDSYVDPLIISIDPDKLTMSVKSMLVKEVPVYQGQPELLPEFARAEELLTYDLLSKPRSKGFAVGPIVDLPFDGSEISIDPRLK
ncbi:MAG: right-handed parallel beta-helix repeat-containing protein [Mangrovibacterium sp.]